MPNPAQLLADLVAAWRVAPQAQVKETRIQALPEGATEPDFWRSHRRAVGYLEEIDIALGGMEAMNENVEHFRNQFPRWHEFVFATEAHWGATPSGGVDLDPTSHDVLRALAQYLDATRYAPDESTGELYVLQQAVGEARDLVLTTGLPPDVSRYLHALLREADDVIKEYAEYGSVRLRSVSLQLGGAMLLASGQPVVTNDPEKVSAFRKVAGKIMLGVLVGIGIHLGDTALEEFFGLDPQPMSIETPQHLEIEAAQPDQVAE